MQFIEEQKGKQILKQLLKKYKTVKINQWDGWSVWLCPNNEEDFQNLCKEYKELTNGFNLRLISGCYPPDSCNGWFSFYFNAQHP